MEIQTYRPPRQLPPNIRDTLKIILEEELFLSGIDLLTSLISQGISSVADITVNTRNATTTTAPTEGSSREATTSTAPLPPIYIPPPIHLTLLTTLLCHPSFTTHISKRSDRDANLAPISAERFLFRLLSLAGPESMDLHSAWSRWNGTLSGINGLWGGGGGRKGAAISTRDDAFEDNALDLNIAGKESLFDRAEDFWAVVGWGFTCACANVGYGVDAEKAKAMRKRWGPWKRVLRVMIEGLERDWSHSIRGEEGGERTERMKKSMIVKWLPSKRGGAGYKRVMRAVMANGKGRLGMEWKEIWGDESASLKEIKQRKQKKTKEDILDSSSDEEDDGDITSKVVKGQESRKDAEGDSTMGDFEDPPTNDNLNLDSATATWGGLEAVFLRQRLLILLSSVCHQQQWVPLYTLHDELTDHLLATDPSSMCLPSIRLFTTLHVHTFNTSHSSLSSATQYTLLTYPPPSHVYMYPLFSALLRTLLSSDAPPPTAYGAQEDLGGPIFPEIFKICYLPYSAKTRSLKDNLKVAVILDQLLRAISREGVEGFIGDDGGAAFVIAMEDGVERRRKEVLGSVKEVGSQREQLEQQGDMASKNVRRKRGGGGGGGGGRKKDEKSVWGEWEAAEHRLRGVVEAIFS